MYDANMQSNPLFTKPVDRQLLQAPDPSPLQDIKREEAASPHWPQVLFLGAVLPSMPSYSQINVTSSIPG